MAVITTSFLPFRRRGASSTHPYGAGWSSYDWDQIHEYLKMIIFQQVNCQYDTIQLFRNSNLK